MSALCNKIYSYGQTKSEAFKVYMALLAGTATPATIFSLISLNFHSWWAIFFVGLIHAIFLGLPLYFIAQKLCWINWRVSLICGFAIGNTLYGLWLAPFGGTLGDWAEFLPFSFFLGCLGASGGLAAWLVWRCLNGGAQGKNQ